MEDSGGPSEELQEVEEELVSKKEKGGEGSQNDDEETPMNDLESGNARHDKNKKRLKNAFWCFSGLDNMKVFTQAFTLTFLAEWGKL
jgi:putative Ca2+/H+ antiporter (TMEM165/GDT1 family)